MRVTPSLYTREGCKGANDVVNFEHRLGLTFRKRDRVSQFGPDVLQKRDGRCRHLFEYFPCPKTSCSQFPPPQSAPWIPPRKYALRLEQRATQEILSRPDMSCQNLTHAMTHASDTG